MTRRLVAQGAKHEVMFSWLWHSCTGMPRRNAARVACFFEPLIKSVYLVVVLMLRWYRKYAAMQKVTAWPARCILVAAAYTGV